MLECLLLPDFITVLAASSFSAIISAVAVWGFTVLLFRRS